MGNWGYNPTYRSYGPLLITGSGAHLATVYQLQSPWNLNSQIHGTYPCKTAEQCSVVPCHSSIIVIGSWRHPIIMVYRDSYHGLFGGFNPVEKY